MLRCHVICKERDRLFDEYNLGVTAWSYEVNRLSDQAGMQYEGYQGLLNAVEEAHEKTRRAKVAYEKHIAEHGC